MVIKKYIVNNMNEAMTRMRYELGNSAVIISQRKIRKKGIKGFFSKKVIEVTAAVDDKSKNVKTKDTDINGSIEAIKKVMNLEKMKPLPKAKEVKKEVLAGSINQSLIDEMKEMKEMLNNLAANTGTPVVKTDLHKKLEEYDLVEDIVEDLISIIKLDKRDVEEDEKIREALSSMIEVCKPSEPKIMVLVGPTGVGKTTTIAKLAGRLSLIQKKKVGLITVDTYRIGAVEQLKTYADIMNIPFSVVFSIKEMEKTIEEMKECDVVLVDTTGRSSKNVMQISELRAFIEKTNSKDIHLVVSSTTKNSDIKTIVEGYRVLNYNNVIVTKLDETSTYGSIINILNYAKKPLSYVTVGQNVPDDLKNLKCEDVVNLIMGVETIC